MILILCMIVNSSLGAPWDCLGLTGERWLHNELFRKVRLNNKFLFKETFTKYDIYFSRL
jgi:hypothetical protein